MSVQYSRDLTLFCKAFDKNVLCVCQIEKKTDVSDYFLE